MDNWARLREKYTVGELQFIVMAAAYEIFDHPVASDSTFDLIAKMYANEGTNIEGFDPSTGQWVHDIWCPELEALTVYCMAKVDSVKHDDTCHHTYVEAFFDEQAKV